MLDVGSKISVGGRAATITRYEFGGNVGFHYDTSLPHETQEELHVWNSWRRLEESGDVRVVEGSTPFFVRLQNGRVWLVLRNMEPRYGDGLDPDGFVAGYVNNYIRWMNEQASGPCAGGRG